MLNPFDHFDKKKKKTKKQNAVPKIALLPKKKR